MSCLLFKNIHNTYVLLPKIVCIIFSFLQVAVNITNDNYLPINIDSLQLSSMLYGDKQLNVSTNYTHISVPMRTTKLHYVTVNLTLGQTKDFRQIV